MAKKEQIWNTKLPRTIWLSDLHLGTKNTHSEELLNFLKTLKPKDKSQPIKKIYLNGDIIDFIDFNGKMFFQNHVKIIKKFLELADAGVKIIWVLGNHEYPIWNYFSEKETQIYNNIYVVKEDIHCIDDKKYLVIHGDQFDGIVRLHPFLYNAGDFVYKILIEINGVIAKLRKLFGIHSSWSFSHWVKTKTKSAIKYVTNFEKIIVDYSKTYQVDGVICGHIHMPENKLICGVHYLNSGTFVEIMSCVVEYYDSSIDVLEIKQ